MNCNSQDFKKHQWNNRVLLVFTDDKADVNLQKQIINLSKEKKGLIERRVKIYRFVKNEFKVDFKTNWTSSKVKENKYKNESESFKIVLIGLDGGIKLKQNDILTTKKLFAIIDRMPMRKSEIRNNN
ncbi:DUF4174 domain-containing protein [Polaribacter sp. R77954]|uniref:DUF4174 domain-containing protein n=1 Tax=Polaribacter sp. R77954 TaxID=3093870 RepID=UPI0037CB54F1